MINLSSKAILVFDLSGSFTHVAERLARDFGHVYYHTLWQSGFSSSKDFLPGFGLPEVERVSDFFNTLDKVDMCMFTDVGYGDLQEFLRREQIPVFGSGRAQELEIDRIALKQALIKAGMATAKSEVIEGIERLRKVLQKEEDRYVKFSFFRGDMETYHHKEWFSTETWLDNLAVILGPYGKVANFLVEEPIEGDAVEVGYDTFAVNGRLPEAMFWGYEVKDAGFLGTTAELPERLFNHANQFGQILEDYEYSGIFSTEVRVTPDEDYLIDFTARCPSPPSEIQCALTENFAELVWEGAHGRLIEPEFKAEYGAMLVLKSDWIVENPLALKIGEKDHVFIHGHFQIEGEDFAVVPEEFAEFGGAVGIADTLEGAIRQAFEAAESVSGYQVRYSGSAFAEALKMIKEGEELGLSWHGTKTVPSPESRVPS